MLRTDKKYYVRKIPENIRRCLSGAIEFSDVQQTRHRLEKLLAKSLSDVKDQHWYQVTLRNVPSYLLPWRKK